MYIEASRPRETGHVATLLSPLLQATDGKYRIVKSSFFGNKNVQQLIYEL